MSRRRADRSRASLARTDTASAVTAKCESSGRPDGWAVATASVSRHGAGEKATQHLEGDVASFPPSSRSPAWTIREQAAHLHHSGAAACSPWRQATSRELRVAPLAVLARGCGRRTAVRTHRLKSIHRLMHRRSLEPSARTGSSTGLITMTNRPVKKSLVANVSKQK